MMLEIKRFCFASVSLLGVILFFSSCATENPEADVFVVELGGDRAKEEITITNKVNTEYGPSPEDGSEVAEGGYNKPGIIALDLFPALYNSLGYVSTFAELEKSKINVNIVSATGFSSILAALYAKYEASNMVEWKTFKLYQLLVSEKPFSDSWENIIKEFLEKEFGNERLSQLKKLLIIPKMAKKKIVIDNNQKIVEAVLDSINFNAGSSLLVSGSFDYVEALREYGADHVIRISFLPKNIMLKHPDGFVFGVYSRLTGKASSLKESDEVFIFNQALSGEIDSFKNLSDTIYQTKDENSFFAEKVSELLENSSGKN